MPQHNDRVKGNCWQHVGTVLVYLPFKELSQHRGEFGFHFDFFFFVRYILVISGRAVTINVNPVSCVPNE